MTPNPNRFAPLTQTLPLTKRTWSATGINVFRKIFDMKRKDLTLYIADTANKFYGQPAKPLQIDTVANLVMGRNTFVLAVLNPLDSLGNNQVFEKELAGFTAINLNKLNFNKKAADDISNGVYQFVYMSPEIFLNNKMWEDVYFSLAFQNRLGLILVDEAHMIYIWGLVKSGPGKNLATIKISLRLQDSNIDILRGELTRPEIRIGRVPMESSMASCHDLIKVFPSSNDVPDAQVVS
ncbi:hypothetical protein PCANC_12209 [Puccinia coronata f. sp. avenae]|uniref:DNA 3'-5' helicase n=1 Tax=Puccinia coronata f. sp. avenae TaxID=200324 RepID=A0A2N5VEY7_9BASI|nr:hypothetical protein PCANC_12209 [Puccinia coronata f. sp. avenae]